MKLPKTPRTYPNDTNLLSLMFALARNDKTLLEFLKQVEFIRAHPSITEEQVRLHMPHNAPRKP